MKRTALTLAALTLLGLTPAAWTDDAWARAGGGSSGGSRGSRSYSAPARPAPSQVSPQRPAAPPPAAVQPAPQRSGWGGMLGGLLLGGLLGGLLFGSGTGQGLFGGIGLLEILIVGGLILFAVSAMRRMSPAPAAPPGYAGGYGGAAWRPDASGASTATLEPAAGPSDQETGIRHIQQMDPEFDPTRFGETAGDIFFKVQAAWMARDVSPIGAVLTPEMQAVLQRDCDRLRAERRINRLESIAVRTVEVTEAWQERGQDYVTVRFLASLLDYTTEEGGSRVLEGSTTEPVKFEEFWTFVRPVGAGPWKLSAIQQPA